MSRLWVGGLEVGISERDLEDEVRGRRRQALANLCYSMSNNMFPAVHKVWQVEECLGRTQGKTRQ